MRRLAAHCARGESANRYRWDPSRSHIPLVCLTGSASPLAMLSVLLTSLPVLSGQRSLQTLPHLRSLYWIHLYQSYLTSTGRSCPRASLVSLIRTRCLHVWPLQKSAMRRVDVKYIHFEKESLKDVPIVKSTVCLRERFCSAVRDRKEANTGPQLTRH
jgi:hypothetical protein